MTKRLLVFRVLEFVLCVLIASMLCRTVQGGFNVPDVVHGYGVNAAVSVILQALLFATMVKPRAKWVLCGVYIGLFAVCAIASIATSTTAIRIDDVQENYFVSVAIFFSVNVACFVLSRTHKRCLVLCGAGGFLAGYIQFMYLTNMTATTMVVVLSALALLFVRSFLDTALRMPVVPKPLAVKGAVVAAVIPFAACFLGMALVLGVIMPLDPPAAELKLQTVYLKYQEEYVQNGVADAEDPNNKEKTNSTDDSKDPKTTNDRQEDEDADQNDGSESKSKDQNKDYLSGEYSDLNLAGAVEGITALALNPSIPWNLIILLVVALVVVALTVPRTVRHRLFIRKVKELPPNSQVKELYRFFLGRFAKLGLAKPENLSVVEYANNFRSRLKPYVGAQTAGSFDHLTALYIQQEYAADPVDQEDLDALYYLYDNFYPNCYKDLGFWRYTFRYYFL